MTIKDQIKAWRYPLNRYTDKTALAALDALEAAVETIDAMAAALDRPCKFCVSRFADCRKYPDIPCRRFEWGGWHGTGSKG